MKSKFRIIFLIILFSFQLGVINSQYVWDSYTMDNLTSQMVEQGDYMWIGSQGSLMRCHKESLEVEFFLSSNSPLRGSGISKICKQNEDVMWFGSYNTGLYRYENGDWQHFESDPSGNPWEEVINLQYSDGILYFANRSYTTDYVRESWSYYGNTFTKLDLVSTFSDFVLDKNGKLYYEDGDNIISYSEGVRDTLFFRSELPLEPDAIIKQIGFTESNDVYFTSISPNLYVTNLFLQTENGFIPYTISSYVTVTFEYQGKLYLSLNYLGTQEGDKFYGELDLEDQSLSLYGEEYLHDMEIGQNYKPYLLTLDSDGRYWFNNFIGKRGNNVSVLDGTQTHTIKVSSSDISSNYIDSFVDDCEGNVLVHSNSEVSVFKNNSWDVHLEHQWPNSTAFTLFLSDTERCIDYVFLDDILYRFSDSDTLVIHHDYGQSFGGVIDESGDVYFGNWPRGYCKFSNGQIEVVDNPWDDFEGLINEIIIDKEGRHWIASGDRGLWTYDGSDFELVDTGLTTHYRVYEDLEGNIWTAQDNILLKYDGVSWSSYLLPELEMSVNSLFQDQSGAIWIGTWEHGLLRWADGQFNLFNTSNSNIISNRIQDIYIDSRGDLWVGSNNGTSRLSLSRGFFGSQIDGFVFFDQDMDGTKGQDEFVIPYQKIETVPSGSVIYTGADGQYSHYPQPSNDVSIALDYDPLFSPTTQTSYDVDNLVSNAVEGDFGLWIDATDAQANITLIPGTFVCNTQTTFQILVRNDYPSSLHGDLYLKHMSQVEIVSPGESGQILNDSTIVFENIQIDPFQYVIYQVNIVVPSEQFVNSSFLFEVEFVNDETGNEVNTSLSETLLCSYDPNDKTCYPQGESLGNQTLVGGRLDYLIRFQNYGNYKATDIVVVDTLSDLLDISTFRLNNTSHRADLSIDSNNVMKVIFDQINLPPAEQDSLASQGYLSYSIYPKADLQLPYLIENTAAIYFDFNEPIITNTTGNEIVLEFDQDGEILSIDEERDVPLEINLFPNPTSGVLYIKEVNNRPIDKILIYTAAGQELSHEFVASDVKISQVTLPEVPGFYLIKIFSGDHFVIDKICKTE